MLLEVLTRVACGDVTSRYQVLGGDVDTCHVWRYYVTSPSVKWRCWHVSRVTSCQYCQSPSVRRLHPAWSCVRWLHEENGDSAATYRIIALYGDTFGNMSCFHNLTNRTEWYKEWKNARNEGDGSLTSAVSEEMFNIKTKITAQQLYF